MDKPITIDGADYGYCLQCGQPAIVGRFALPGWRHKATICAPCLEALARLVVNLGQMLK